MRTWDRESENSSRPYREKRFLSIRSFACEEMGEEKKMANINGRKKEENVVYLKI